MANNRTKQDAKNRMLLAVAGSLVEPTEEYLYALEYEINKWLKQIREYRAREGK